MNKIFTISLVAFIITGQSLPQTQYEFIYLGTFGGNIGSANDINDFGQIVGQASYPDNTARAFLWEDSIMIDLGTLGGQHSGANGINNEGKIVGIAGKSNGFSSAFLWQNGSMIDLGTFGGNNSVAYDINDLGHVVGVADTIQHPNKRAFIFEEDSLRFLGTLGGYESWAYAINNSGQVVGSARDTDQVQRPFLWENGEMIALGNLYGGAYDINNDGKIVGAYLAPNGFGRAFLWENGSLTDLGTLGGNNSAAQGINELSQVVGYSEDANGNPKAFIWENGVMSDLNSLTTSLPLIVANSINNLNQIVGAGGGIPWLLVPGNIISEINSPSVSEKWISGETHTISWTGPDWNAINIRCITNFETPLQSEIIIAQGAPILELNFDWQIPNDLLSYRSKIIVENANNISEKIESQIFRIKPYVLTRVNPDSTYYDYKKTRDQWGFSNILNDMWPPSWWLQFNYNGTDPFTNSQYSQWQADEAFKSANHAKHSDWVSWVNTFLVDECYYSTFLGIYKSAAVLSWKSSGDNWGGSCFGIAGANALAFGYKNQFQNKFPEFPNFVNPVSVVSDSGVKKVVNEIFTHQYGNPSIANDQLSLGIKTPNQTIAELKQLFMEDNSEARSITIYNNSGSGAHTILPYGLRQDTTQENIFYILVYDNSYPNSNNPIIVDTSGNGGTGLWSNADWAGWGGNYNLYLELTSDTYLNTAIFPKVNEYSKPFIKGNDILEINKPSLSSIKIIDESGNTTGHFNNTIYSGIPGSISRFIKNGNETPPYGYSLMTNNYSVILDEIQEDTLEVYFFTGNKSFSYERESAEQTETDKLFFDGGVSISNPDVQTKTVKLLNLINETSQEKLFVVRSLNLVQNDSIKIENPDSNKVKLISYGSAKEYDIELNYTTEAGVGRFGDFDITLSENTSHTFIPEWTDITNTELKVLIDVNNDGTIDDTLSLKNEVTGIEDEGSLLSPNSYNLAQNYPNPFNPLTTIQYSIPQGGHVSLKVYDILASEVATLVNEGKEIGVYSVTFDASHLASGIYFYRIQSGSFNQVKKMILIK